MAAAAAEGILLYLRAPLAGLWHDEYQSAHCSGGEASPASSFYHIISAIAELDVAVEL